MMQPRWLVLPVSLGLALWLGMAWTVFQILEWWG